MSKLKFINSFHLREETLDPKTTEHCVNLGTETFCLCFRRAPEGLLQLLLLWVRWLEGPRRHCCLCEALGFGLGSTTPEGKGIQEWETWHRRNHLEVCPVTYQRVKLVAGIQWRRCLPVSCLCSLGFLTAGPSSCHQISCLMLQDATGNDKAQIRLPRKTHLHHFVHTTNQSKKKAIVWKPGLSIYTRLSVGVQSVD